MVDGDECAVRDGAGGALRGWSSDGSELGASATGTSAGMAGLSGVAGGTGSTDGVSNW